ncbi:MAG: glycogen-binding domain-containing protein [Phycisphaerales bacterium]
MGHHEKNGKHGKHGGLVLSTKAPKAKEVFVAGTFNEWNPSSHPLKRTGDGQWALTLDLPPGRHEYKFVIDGQWCCEAGCDKHYDGCPGCVANQFGTMNRILEVKDAAEQADHLRQLA